MTFNGTTRRGCPMVASTEARTLSPPHFRDLEEILGDMGVHIDGIVPAGDEVFVRLRVHLGTPRGGLLLDGPIFETVSIKHGKVSRIRLFLDEREALEAAGLPE